MISKDEWLETFSANLQRIMNDRGISQRELADAAGISEAAVSRYINKRQVPNGNTIVIMAKVLKCKTADLIGV